MMTGLEHPPIVRNMDIFGANLAHTRFHAKGWAL